MEEEGNKEEPPPSQQTASGTNESQPRNVRQARQLRVPRRLRNQTNSTNTNQDDELKAQMRAARENAATTTVNPNESMTIPDENQGIHVGDDVDVEHLVSVPSTPRRAESGDTRSRRASGARIPREPSIRSMYTSGQRRSFAKEPPTPLPNGHQVGAVEVQERAFGYNPAWNRQSPESRSPMSTENMILRNEQEGVDVSQPFEAVASEELTMDDISLEDLADATHHISLASGSRESGSIDATIVSEDSTVEDSSKAILVRKTFGVFVFLLAIVGVVIVVSVWKEKQDASVEIAPPTTALTVAPTQFSVLECSDFVDIDPLVQMMDVDTFDQYNLLLENVVQRLMPEYTSPENVLEELCSPYHRALVWLASDALSKESFKVAENRYLLAFLFLSWKGDTWSEQRPWLSNATECDWLGISCNESGQIVELHWSISKPLTELSVTIPEEIGLLTDLTSLKLNVNFVGSVPNTIGNLTNLEILDISSNFQLSGTFPYDNVAQLDKLRTLSLSDASFLAFPPSSINQLSSLEYLDVSRTQRSNQDLPTEIGDLMNLVVLSARETGANGRIPSEISKLTNLEYLNLGINDIQDKLVTEIGLLENLSMLILDDNALSGQIPSEIGSLSLLETLKLEGNLFTGALPREVGNCTFLDYLSLSRTDVDEDLPMELFSLTNLKTVDFAETLFVGNTTIDLSGLTSLECFDITSTVLIGTLIGVDACRLDFASSNVLEQCNTMQLDTCTCCQDQENCDGVQFQCQENERLFDMVPQSLKDRFLQRPV